MSNEAAKKAAATPTPRPQLVRSPAFDLARRPNVCFGVAAMRTFQDHPRIRRREPITLMKNRMREIRTSGSVGDGDGDAPVYPAKKGDSIIVIIQRYSMQKSISLAAP